MTSFYFTAIFCFIYRNKSKNFSFLERVKLRIFHFLHRTQQQYDSNSLLRRPLLFLQSYFINFTIASFIHRQKWMKLFVAVNHFIHCIKPEKMSWVFEKNEASSLDRIKKPQKQMMPNQTKDFFYFQFIFSWSQ